ncbi:MAG: hypothetical protein WD942_10800 [Dehalococcoidia bacterium]
MEIVLYRSPAVRTASHGVELGENRLLLQLPVICVLQRLLRAHHHVHGQSDDREHHCDPHTDCLGDRITGASLDIAVDPQDRSEPENEEVPADQRTEETDGGLPVTARPRNCIQVHTDLRFPPLDIQANTLHAQVRHPAPHVTHLHHPPASPDLRTSVDGPWRV